MLGIRTFSGRRYRVAGKLPSPFADEFHRRLTDRRFLPLTAREETTHGWVTADNLLLTDFDVDTVVRGNHAAFALRVDRRRVNARMLRAQMDLEIRGRLKAAEDMGKPRRITRDERRQMRSDLRDQLLLDTNPAVQVCTVLVHTKRRVLHVLTLAKTLNELVVKTFGDTFGAQLVPLTPWHRAGEILAGSPAADAVGGLERTDYTGPVGRAGLFPEEPSADAPSAERVPVSEGVVPEAAGLPRGLVGSDDSEEGNR